MDVKALVVPSAFPESGEFDVLATLYQVKDQTTSAMQSFTIKLIRAGTSVNLKDRVRFETVLTLWGAAPPVLEMTVLGEPLEPLSVYSVGQLRDAAGRLLPATLKANVLPASLGSNSRAKATSISLSTIGDPPIGTATGQIRIEAPQLAAPVILDVDWVTRVWGPFLLLPLLAGILISYMLRVTLAGQQAREEARLRGADLLASIYVKAEREPEPTVRQSLLAIADDLQSGLREEIVKERLDPIIMEAQSRLDAAIVTAEGARSDLRKRIDALAAYLSPPRRYEPPLDRIFSDAIVAFALIREQANAGELERPARALARLERALDGEIADDVEGWLERTVASIGEFEPWMKLPAAADLTHIANTARELRGEASPLTLFTKGNELGRKLRDVVCLTLAVSVRGLVSELADGLRRIGKPAQAANLRDTLEKRRTWLEQRSDPLDSLVWIADLLRAAEAAYIEAFPDRRQAIIQALHAGQADQVIAAVTKSATESGILSQAHKPVIADFPPRGVKSRSASILQLDMAVEVSPLGSDRQSTVTAHLWADPPIEPSTSINWSLPSGVTEQEIARGEAAFKIGPGLYELAVRVTDKDGLTECSVRKWFVVGSVRAAAGTGQAQKAIWRVELYKTIPTAIVTAAVGYFLFESDWTGVPRDWFAAFLWGFSVDLGTTKLTEYAKPYLSRTLTTVVNSAPTATAPTRPAQLPATGG